MSEKDEGKDTRELASRYPFEDLWEGFQRSMFEPWFKRSWLFPRRMFLPSERWTRTPLVDMIDNGKEYVVRAEVPGFTKDDIEIDVTKDSVEITGKAEAEKKKEKENYQMYERSYESINRRLMFQEKVKPEDASATLKNGILEIKVPKVEPTPVEEKHKVKID
jgi:HSP20 family protein